MKLKNALMLVMVAGLLAYGGSKGYIYFKAKEQMDNLVTLAAPFADLSYEGISSSLAGEIGVEGLRVAPQGAPMAIEVDSITLRGDGIGFLFDLLGGVNLNQPPERLSLAVKGMRIPVGSDFAAQFNPGLTAQMPETCSLGGILQYAGLSAVGIEQVHADAHFGYRLNPRAGELTLRFSHSLEGIESASFEVELQNVSSPGAMAMGAMPTLRRLRMSYSPAPDYINKVVGHCAREAGLPAAAFIDGLFAGDKAYYANNLGFIPGRGIREALKELLTQPGELLLTATPDASVNPAMLAAYKPADIVSMLNMGLSINGKPVGDLSLEVPDLKQLVSQFSRRMDGNSVDADRYRPGQKRVTRPKARFIATPVAELQHHIGRAVRLYTKDDKIQRKPKQGVLVAMQGKILDVEQRLHGGKLTVHIPLDAIDHAEVLRRP